MHFIRNQKGQSLVEYMIIVALMAVGTMGLMRILAQNANGKLTQITHSIQGGESKIDVNFDKATKTDLKKKDMKNFIQGSRSKKD